MHAVVINESVLIEGEEKNRGEVENWSSLQVGTRERWDRKSGTWKD